MISFPFFTLRCIRYQTGTLDWLTNQESRYSMLNTEIWLKCNNKKHSDNYYAAANKSKKLFHSASCFVLCSKIRLCISSNLFNYELLRKYYVRYSIYVGITYAFAILLGQSCIPLLCSLLFKDVSTMDVLLWNWCWSLTGQK